MTGLNNLKPAYGSRHNVKRLGRGEGSGRGGSCGKGMRGQKSRSGDGKMIGFEGGQMPLYRRIPKRGFTNRSRVEYVHINLDDLDKIFKSGSEVTPEILRKKGIIKRGGPVKVLGNGELKKPLTIKVNAFSKTAKDKIKNAGGTAEVVK